MVNRSKDFRNKLMNQSLYNLESNSDASLPKENKSITVVFRQDQQSTSHLEDLKQPKCSNKTKSVKFENTKETITQQNDAVQPKDLYKSQINDNEWDNIDMHDLMFRVQQLEQQRKECAFSSIAAKSRVRHNASNIKTYRKRIDEKNVSIKEQCRYIDELKNALAKIQKGIQEFSQTYGNISDTIRSRTQLNQLFDQQQEESPSKSELKSSILQETIDQPRRESKIHKAKKIKSDSSQSSVVYNNINEIPSDQSFSSGNEHKEHFNKGTWTEKERYKYLQFVDENRDIIDNFELCYKEKIFVKLAQVIGTRSANQCRSFHKQLIHKQKKFVKKTEQQ